MMLIITIQVTDNFWNSLRKVFIQVIFSGSMGPIFRLFSFEFNENVNIGASAYQGIFQQENSKFI